MMKTYTVWRKQRADYGGTTEWIKTSHTIEARSEHEAETKLKRRFLNSGFSLMSLVAIPEGKTP